jgi:L-lactate dehydrogenase complex protein LldG
MTTGKSLESGDRDAFLGHLLERLQGPERHNLAHPMPGPLSAVPLVRSSMLDEHDVLGSFVRNATAVAARVHDLDAAAVPEALVADVVARHGIRHAVLSAEPEAISVGEQLAAIGVTTAPLEPDAAATADLGVTSCVGAIATTGTVVVSTTAAGGRSASLLPPVHLCVVPASSVAPTSAEILRPLSSASSASGASMPSNLVLITGPSRSGDIEQIIALGVHGPLAVELVLLRGA